MNTDQLRTHKASHDKTNSWWLKDARGIEVSRVCFECEAAVKAQYDPAVFGHGRYEEVVEEQIENDY